jgi:hypothetical protein
MFRLIACLIVVSLPRIYMQYVLLISFSVVINWGEMCAEHLAINVLWQKSQLMLIAPVSICIYLI